MIKPSDTIIHIILDILARKAGVETMVKLKILYNLDEDTHIFESLTLCHKGLTIIARESQFQLIGPDINWTINRTEIKQLEAWIEE
jgi:hypothetical protein